jgi:hypothetical protein
MRYEELSSPSVIRIRLVNEFETDHACDFFSNGSVNTYKFETDHACDFFLSGSVNTYMFENASHDITNI